MASCGFGANGFQCWTTPGEAYREIFRKAQGRAASSLLSGGSAFCLVDTNIENAKIPKGERHITCVAEYMTPPKGDSDLTSRESDYTLRLPEGSLVGVHSDRICWAKRSADGQTFRVGCNYSENVDVSEHFRFPSPEMTDIKGLVVGGSFICLREADEATCISTNSAGGGGSAPPVRLPIKAGDRVRSSNSGLCWADSNQPSSPTVQCEVFTTDAALKVAMTPPNDIKTGALGALVDLTTGSDFACALFQDGLPRCWGYSFSSGLQLPAELKGAQTLLVGLSASTYSGICGLTRERQPFCWGGAAIRRPLPTGTVPVSVGLGNYNTCAWNDRGLVCDGLGLQSPPSYDELLDVQITRTGYDSACLLHRSSAGFNEVKCWGETKPINAVPHNLQNPRLVSVGESQACAVDDFGVRCWGNNAWGDTPANSVDPKKLLVGSNFGCLLDAFGLACFGNVPSSFATESHLFEPGAVVDFALGGFDQMCVITRDQQVKCFGINNNLGQLKVPSIKNPTSIVSGAFYTCVKDNRGVVCWGDVPAGL
jgi:hypothetical protein